MLKAEISVEDGGHIIHLYSLSLQVRCDGYSCGTPYLGQSIQDNDDFVVLSSNSSLTPLKPISRRI